MRCFCIWEGQKSVLLHIVKVEICTVVITFVPIGDRYKPGEGQETWGGSHFEVIGKFFELIFLKVVLYA